jgi:hypothetical protein
MAKPADLPPWLRRRAGERRSAGRTAGWAGAAIALLAAGGVAGFLFAKRLEKPAVAVAAAPVCPPAPACPDPHVGGSSGGGPTRPRPVPDKRAKGARTTGALQPLPDKTPLDENARAAALRAFAEKKAPELRDCLPEPDRGPPLKLGAAFEIDAGGAVDVVQILGAEGAPKEVRRCYAKRLKRWRFPEDLLRGEEKLLVNFVL